MSCSQPALWASCASAVRCRWSLRAGLLLGNLCESNFRRALSMSLGDYSIFLTRPITVVLLILTVLSLVLPAIGQLRKKSKAAK